MGSIRSLLAPPVHIPTEVIPDLTPRRRSQTRKPIEPAVQQRVLFLPPEVVQFPPEGGWEHITPEFSSNPFCLVKNDTVADLMKHIPYVSRTKEDHWDQPWMVYEGRHRCRFPLVTRAISRPRPFRPHVFVYATIPSGREGHCIFIDTERGTIILVDPQTGPKPTKLSDPKAPDEEAWRRFQTYTFREFFAMAKEKFKKFEMIYREEGVFTERYDRERCMNRLDEYEEQQQERENRKNRGA
ncbi:hypothetical protein CFIO01_09399 [Colletotrichum fioriniae PJ7]|uniref:Uncharacterized protein n=1 Tax=Colletotrichum fioriniae PJ7 TaxID=1445577 RepID=A0A010RWS6_9PEZI|nr:hypothetical protein CFIO01_09399 [Colletotrichum fioriniae PJ7]